MIDVKDLFLVILYMCLIILVITSTIAMIKLIKTLNNLNPVVEDVNIKVNKLNGVFDIVDSITDSIATLSDKVCYFVSNGISKLTKRKGDKDEKNKNR